MKWSIQELLIALSWQWTGWWVYKILHSPKNIYRSIGIIIFWTFKGYTKESLYSLDWWLDRVILFRLKKFAGFDRMGHPTEDCINTEEDCKTALDTMIEGFEEILNDVAFDERCKYLEEQESKGLKFGDYKAPKEFFENEIKLINASQLKKDLFWKYYNNLWD